MSNNKNYAAILRFGNDIDYFIRQIDSLELQKYPPSSYNIVSLDCSIEEKNKIQNKLIKTNKPWRLKIRSIDSPELSENDLIDEFFITKVIKENRCLEIRNIIKPSFSEKLYKCILDNENCWMYKLDSNTYFYTMLCDSFNFENLEKGLISMDYQDKIYNEHTIAQL